MTYQPQWDGTQETPGRRDGVVRYGAISRLLHDSYGPGQRFNVLDLGSNEGYFTRRIVDEFTGAHVTAADSDRYRRYPAYKHPNIDMRARYLSVMDVVDGPEYDVILALSVLHHIPLWELMLPALVRKATNCVVVETPTPAESLPNARAHCRELFERVRAQSEYTLCAVPGYDARHLRPTFVLMGKARP